MALSKSITLASGFAATYHRVEKITAVITQEVADPALATVAIILGRYKDGDAEVPAQTNRYSLAVPLVPASATGDAMVAAAYVYLKTLEEFSGAEDC